jgi:hypothetical protein
MIPANIFQAEVPITLGDGVERIFRLNMGGMLAMDDFLKREHGITLEQALTSLSNKPLKDMDKIEALKISRAAIFIGLTRHDKGDKTLTLSLFDTIFDPREAEQYLQTAVHGFSVAMQGPNAKKSKARSGVKPSKSTGDKRKR